MDRKTIFLGTNILNTQKKETEGQFVEIEGEKFYKISNFHKIPDFFISIVSSSNHWMYISSNGSLTAGRKNRDNALFPYYTEDKIHAYRGLTGSSSCFIIEKDGKNFLWEPFNKDTENIYSVDRYIYKSIYGNKILFEEVNHNLEIKFQYGWYNSEQFGFVKKSKIVNLGKIDIHVDILDGIRNILPSGIDYNFQNEYSNLLDAYKKNELLKESGIGLFILSSIPVDRAEPSESLLATTVWSSGLEKPKILLSGKQLSLFKDGFSLEAERDIRASRGAYYVNKEILLKANSEKNWMFVAEINQDSNDVTNLNHFVLSNPKIDSLVNSDINKGTTDLKKMVSAADGFQMTSTDLCYARHYSNTLFNIMRGGVFANNYIIETYDYKNYLNQINKLIYKDYKIWLQEIPAKITYSELIALAEKTANNDLIRITYEYLPLTFSRRHGDPSRPWNLFSIETKNKDGSVKYHYEGNWRDIFQNWEALCYSYPEFIEGMISKFVNASTIDGYNPYRIMRNGIDWEHPDPDDPWSYIGYWGDHQIIYLQKLLELSNHFHPGKLNDLLYKEVFTYANVPYRIKSYNDIVKNPKDTIVFNDELNSLITAMKDHVGADAKVLKCKDVDKAYKVNLMEKILVTLLSKLCNFIPEAGIWLNTQRPEWNDANNALVGNGTSMVTVYHLRRFLKFWEDKLSNISSTEIAISNEVGTLFHLVFKIYKKNLVLVNKGFSDFDRRNFIDSLGKTHEAYRNKIYTKSFSGAKSNINTDDLLDFTSTCLKYIEQSIKSNQKEDGLYHSYNLISIKDDKITIRHLYEMLEGQVAILSSGYLSAYESLQVLDSLKNSKIFRSDQYSYMLYPDRQLSLFIEKNIIPENRVRNSRLLSKLIQDKDDSVIKEDDTGKFHFNSSFRNADVLEKTLNNLKNTNYSQLLEEEKEEILEIYEQVFDHKSFTGRSGTFYGYEGLGSIYWHMVSKLLLATQESYFNAIDEGADEQICGKIKGHYYEIKAGIGLYKSPKLYGAFPTDAYSHTPGNAGVKQPGLTGQVKEDVISRLGELGIRIKNGQIVFDTSLLNYEEILTSNAELEFYSIEGDQRKIPLDQNQLALTFCQTPIIYTNSTKNQIMITFKNNEQLSIQGTVLTKEISNQLFERNGNIKQINVLTILGKH